ncbi:hypothetical protein H257_11637 [Aphanomyces astaci]|uniref:Uncharacterized protein n=1 Tax=Aphanomyces astaci TaxID=112090 RepID=W4G1C6_APHAT|nr:hypothetical protein H257_11637 [Aphanomyces astaci]ETV73512.1 hypothetical protein H257_11637 [Aphanomyces astaci]|eukprot:XP_009836938.1 hypothetical protein H257_11637 [Aphanomyces astaci]
MNVTSFIIDRCIIGTIRLPRPAHYSAYRARISPESIIVGDAALSSVPPPEARALPQTIHELCKAVVGRWNAAAKRSKLHQSDRPVCLQTGSPPRPTASARLTASYASTLTHPVNRFLHRLWVKRPPRPATRRWHPLDHDLDLLWHGLTSLANSVN